MFKNTVDLIGFIGKNAETKYLANGTPVTKFSVATKKSWKDENDEWKEKTQWHNVTAFGKGFAQLADRLVKGAHVFVQAFGQACRAAAQGTKVQPGRP